MNHTDRWKTTLGHPSITRREFVKTTLVRTATGIAIAIAVLIGSSSTLQATTSNALKVEWRSNPSKKNIVAIAESNRGLFVVVAGTAEHQPERGTIFRLNIRTGTTQLMASTAGQPVAIVAQNADVWLTGIGLSLTRVVDSNQVLHVSGSSLHDQSRVNILNPIGIALGGTSTYVLSGGTSGAQAVVYEETRKAIRRLAVLKILNVSEGNPIATCGRYLYVVAQVDANSDAVFKLNPTSGNVMAEKKLSQSGYAYSACAGSNLFVGVSGGDVYEIPNRGIPNLVERTRSPLTGLVAGRRLWTLSTGRTIGSYFLQGMNLSGGSRSLDTRITLRNPRSGGPGILSEHGDLLLTALGSQIIEFRT